MYVVLSDDRNAAQIKEKIENSIMMKSLFSDGKPNLMILDEIDGIAGNSKGEVTDVTRN